MRPVTDDRPPDQAAPAPPVPAEAPDAAPGAAVPPVHELASVDDAPTVPASGIPPGSRPAARSIQYKGANLDAERGPGLGCFWFQVIVLAFLIVLTPMSVSLNWPSEVSAILLFVTIGLLLVAGQTIIFLLRLVAADRRGRRRPLASQTRTVGELEDAHRAASPSSAAQPASAPEQDERGDVRQ